MKKFDFLGAKVGQGLNLWVVSRFKRMVINKAKSRSLVCESFVIK
jgi:hypothetical protein